MLLNSMLIDLVKGITKMILVIDTRLYESDLRHQEIMEEAVAHFIRVGIRFTC